MKRNTGSYVIGDSFFGRKKELERFDYILTNTNSSILIPGPRRIGKSSLVREYMRLNEDKYKFIYMDLERRNSIIEFCTDLKTETEKDHFSISKIMDSTRRTWNSISQALQEIEIAEAKIKTGQIIHDLKYNLSKMNDVFEDLYKQKHIFAFDEFSDFLLNLKKNNSEEVYLFLKWMRELRQTNKIRLIISGSINITSTAEELNVSDLINDLTEIEILPLTEKEIMELIRELLEDTKIAITEDVLEYALTKVGDGIPFFIQMFADALAYYHEEGIKEYNHKEIDNIYNKIISKKHKEFNDLHDRLKDYLKENEIKAAWKILAHLSNNSMAIDDLWPYVSELLQTKEKLEKLLKRLEDESYIWIDKDLYSFRSRLLSDWWKINYQYERN
jgi:AAA+ ATPase superfamily predicted ATPase